MPRSMTIIAAAFALVGAAALAEVGEGTDAEPGAGKAGAELGSGQDVGDKVAPTATPARDAARTGPEPAASRQAPVRAEGRGGRHETGHAAAPPAQPRLKQDRPRGKEQARAQRPRSGAGEAPRSRPATARGPGLRQAAAVGGLIAGCPPLLATGAQGCSSLAEVEQTGGWRKALSQPGWWGLSNLAAGDYAYDDGYLLRLANGRIAGWLPLLGGALAPGHPWPKAYRRTNVSPYHRDFYALGSSYARHDDVLYRLDPQSSSISSIAALLSGDPFAVGEPMPPGYDVYNVPVEHRARYADGPQATYRYCDGYIYRVDPRSRRVAAAIELLG